MIKTAVEQMDISPLHLKIYMKEGQMNSLPSLHPAKMSFRE
jgi:hypothetical protein